MIYLGDKPVGIGNNILGNLTKYAEMTVYSDVGNSNLEFNHSLGVVPKIIVITSDIDITNRIVSAVISTEAGAICVVYNNSSGVATPTTFTFVDTFDGSYKTVHVDANQIQIAKNSSSIGWVGSTREYHAFLYA